MTDYSLLVQEAYLNDWEQSEAAHAEAQQELEYQELLQKSYWISELLNDFNISDCGKAAHFNSFTISLRGLESVNLEETLNPYRITELSNEVLIFTKFSQEEIIEKLAIAAYLALEEKIETEIPTHQTDDELPF